MPRVIEEIPELTNRLLDRGWPATMTRTEAAQYANLSRTTLYEAIKDGSIVVQHGKIPLGSLARYILGIKKR